MVFATQALAGRRREMPRKQQHQVVALQKVACRPGVEAISLAGPRIAPAVIDEDCSRAHRLNLARSLRSAGIGRYTYHHGRLHAACPAKVCT